MLYLPTEPHVVLALAVTAPPGRSSAVDDRGAVSGGTREPAGSGKSPVAPGPSTEAMKTCTRCGAQGGTDLFYERSQRCKPCCRELAKERHEQIRDGVGPPLRRRRPLVDRLMDHVQKTDAGCWLWTARINPRDGYGYTTVDGISVAAHRAVYEALRGPIPEGLDLDHVCHNVDAACPGGIACWHRPCVNPDHLQPETRRQNLLNGKTDLAANIAKTHCPAGHPYSYTSPTGKRRCRECSKTPEARARDAERQRRNRRQRREAA